MKAKLVKLEDGYNLYVEQPLGMLLEATCSISEIKRLKENNISIKKLSLENCEDIENGYDLDKLFESIPRNLTDENDKWKLRAGFITGFEKALEILGDKKFDMNDIALAFRAGIEHGLNPKKLNTTEYVQSLQQTEWDVEIEMETCSMNPLDLDCSEIFERPKLDSNGCLTLKKI